MRAHTQHIHPRPRPPRAFHAFMHARTPRRHTTPRATTIRMDDDATMMTTEETTMPTTTMMTTTTMDRDDAPTTTRTDDDEDSNAGAVGRGGGGRGRREREGRRNGRGGETNRRYREGTRDSERHNRPFRERATTRPGWAPTGAMDPSSGRPEHSGQCEGCKVSTVVNFRPVVGGNPPLCGVCLDSLKAATGGGVGTEGERAGGPHRGDEDAEARRGAAAGSGSADEAVVGFIRTARTGGQMVMVDPRMMAAYGGHGGG